MTKYRFNAETDVPPGVGTVPKGKYPVVITDSEIKDTHAGDGKYILFNFEVAAGKHQGHVVFERINIENPNEMAVALGLHRLSEICKAVGVLKLTNTTKLHNKRMTVMLDVEEGQGEYPDQNVLKKILAKTEDDDDDDDDEDEDEDEDEGEEGEENEWEWEGDDDDEDEDEEPEPEPEPEPKPKKRRPAKKRTK